MVLKGQLDLTELLTHMHTLVVATSERCSGELLLCITMWEKQTLYALCSSYGTKGIKPANICTFSLKLIIVHSSTYKLSTKSSLSSYSAQSLTPWKCAAS